MSEPKINPQDVRLFSGSSHPALAQGIADYLGLPLEKTFHRRFSNDNVEVQLGASVRSRAVFIVQPLVPPASENLLELLMMLDIARSAAAREVHAIIPYFSYARSDKKDAPRISITARLIADLIKTAGATQVMTLTLHSPQAHGFFSVPTDPLTARGIFVDYFKKRNLDKTIVVAPDMGHAKPSARFAHSLNLPFVAAEKERLSDTEVRVSGLFAQQVRGFRRVLIYDDEIATAGSVVELSRVLVENGIEEIIAICTHGVFTGRAFERLASLPQITELVTTDSVPPSEKRPPNLTVLSVAPLFGEAIRRNYMRQSIGDLFTYWKDDEQADE